MRSKLRGLLSIMLLSVVPAAAQSPRPSILRGGVFADASNVPLKGAEVGISELGVVSKTDSVGHFRLGNIQPGRRIVEVRLLGFAAVRHVLSFVEGDSVDLDFTMVPTMPRVAPITVTAIAPATGKLADFERRRATGHGHFLTREDLAKHENRLMAEILALVPGIQVQRSKNASSAWAIGARGTQSFLRNCSQRDMSDLVKGAGCACYAAVFLDGALTYGGNEGELLFDVNSVRPADIAGIEYYGGGAVMPPEFNGTRLACGALVIWTRVK